MQPTSLSMRLTTLSDEQYRIFNESLIPGTGKTYGVPIPKLRLLAKEILAADWRLFLATCTDDSQEELLIQALVIAAAPCALEEQFTYIRTFVPKIQNWAVCDTFCAALKVAKKHPDALFSFLTPYLQSEVIFARRFAVVLLLDHFLTPRDFDRALDAMLSVDTNDYYVAMAVAWGLSIAFIRQPETILPLLRAQTLSAEVQNKTIQKIRDSKRVSPAHKALVATYRKKE